ncbi:MAG: Flp pilus assembly complex ATPase component TadA [Clostridia bacterium]|nr:Flp pilus assembly complex ATPase component TadA [Clostridia bacterium]
MTSKKRISEILVERHQMTRAQADQILAVMQGGRTGKSEQELILEREFAAEKDIASAVAFKYGLPLVELEGKTLDDELIRRVDINILKKHRIVPVALTEGVHPMMQLAMFNPMNAGAIEDVELLSRMSVEPVVSTATEIMNAIDKCFGTETMRSAVDRFTKEREKNAVVIEEERGEDVSSAPIVVLVNTLLEQAARQRASDIHIEALQESLRVRFRIDGVMYTRHKYSDELTSAVLARVKILAGMDISEKRKPQDGRMTYFVDGREYDIRVSVLPTTYGEKCVMRLALKKSLNRDKKTLGLTDDDMKKFNHIMSYPNGIVLVTGPTGSGKSTTLYTVLSEKNREEVNIVTVEDPVEANIDGINQVQVNPKADLTFASALRSILRQDPDIIMIGEIRDVETAMIAIQASITGHLVVSTVHTNSAANTVTRLLDMGVDSYLIADSVVGIIAQRLVRRLCPNCKRKRRAEEYELEFMGLDPKKPTDIWEPCGCQSCNGTGYYGRIGVYEIMELSPAIKRLINKRATAEEIKQQALADGMQTLRMNAAKLVLEGTTSFQEILGVSFDN